MNSEFYIIVSIGIGMFIFGMGLGGFIYHQMNKINKG